MSGFHREPVNFTSHPSRSPSGNWWRASSTSSRLPVDHASTSRDIAERTSESGALQRASSCRRAEERWPGRNLLAGSRTMGASRCSSATRRTPESCTGPSGVPVVVPASNEPETCL